jgi:hypothetical protein
MYSLMSMVVPFPQFLRSHRQRVIAELMLYFHSHRQRVISALTVLAKGDEDYSSKLPKGAKVDIVKFCHFPKSLTSTLAS